MPAVHRRFPLENLCFYFFATIAQAQEVLGDRFRGAWEAAIPKVGSEQEADDGGRAPAVVRRWSAERGPGAGMRPGDETGSMKKLLWVALSVIAVICVVAVALLLAGGLR